MIAAQSGAGRLASAGELCISPAVARQALVVLVAIGVALAGGAAQAQTDTHVKVGIGPATTSYRSTDELRDAQHRPLTDTTGQALPDNGKIDLNQGNWHAFLDVYVAPKLAIGLQYQQASGTRSLDLAPNQTASLFGQNTTGTTYEEQVELTAWFLTMSWLPMRKAASEFGFVGGLGQATYTYNQYLGPFSGMYTNCSFGMMCGGHHGSQAGYTSSVAPAAALAGLFLDIGTTLGIRLGANYIYMPSTTLTARQPVGPVKEFRVDGSGVALTLDVRIGS